MQLQFLTVFVKIKWGSNLLKKFRTCHVSEPFCSTALLILDFTFYILKYIQGCVIKLKCSVNKSIRISKQRDNGHELIDFQSPRLIANNFQALTWKLKSSVICCMYCEVFL